MTVLLRDAIKPNLLQTLEGGPAFVHCGPFANIAHGNNSIIADRLALATNDIVVHRGRLRRRHGRREVLRHQVPRVGPRAGCGRRGRHGPGAQDARRRRQDRGRQAARSGAARGERRGRPAPAPRTWRSRSRTCDAFGVPAVVAINSFPTDTPAEVEAIREVALAAGARDAVVATHFADGGAGAAALAEAVWAAAEERGAPFQLALPGRHAAREKIDDDRHEGLRRRRASTSLPAAAKALKQYEDLGLRPPADLHGQDPVLAEPRRRAQGPPDRLHASRSARSGCRPGPGSSPRSAARCGRCRGCRRGRAARRSTSTPTGTSSGCSERWRRDRRRAVAASGRLDHDG